MARVKDYYLYTDEPEEIMSRKKFEIIATAFDSKNKVISSARNSYNDSCSLMRYYAVKTANYDKVFNHAEIACIAKALKTGRHISKLVIMRYDSEGNLKNAKPCKVCARAISDFNIKDVFYSDDGGIKKYEQN